MNRIDAPIIKKEAISADGTSIGYYVAGKGDTYWIIPPGLGTPLISWKHIFEYFQGALTMITWDLRGTYQSGVPDDPDHLSVQYHAEDINAVVTAEGLDRFILGGWSIAVQSSLEYYHQHPEKVQAMILLNGAYEYVLSTAFSIPGANTLFPSILRASRRIMPVVNPTMRFLLGMDSTVKILNRMRIVSANFEFFELLVREFRNLDWDVYFQLMLQANEHSADPYLEEVTVPTLITVGTKDAMTPVSTSQIMHDRIRDSELFYIPNGTHYTIAEYPEIVNLRLEKFLRKITPESFRQ